MNQFPLSPWLYRIVSFKFFPKFEEMFTNFRVLTGGVALQIALVSCDFVMFKVDWRMDEQESKVQPMNQ